MFWILYPAGVRRWYASCSSYMHLADRSHRQCYEMEQLFFSLCQTLLVNSLIRRTHYSTWLTQRYRSTSITSARSIFRTSMSLPNKLGHGLFTRKSNQNLRRRCHFTPSPYMSPPRQTGRLLVGFPAIDLRCLPFIS